MASCFDIEMKLIVIYQWRKSLVLEFLTLYDNIWHF